MRRLCFTFIFAVILTAFFMFSAAGQEQQSYCFPDLQTAVAQLKKHGEKFKLTAVMKIGALVHIYSNESTMTILIENPTGMVCTGPALLGDVLNYAKKDTCA